MNFNVRIFEVKTMRDARRKEGRAFKVLEKVALRLRQEQFKVERRDDRKRAKAQS